jgi:hypothetical protein
MMGDDYWVSLPRGNNTIWCVDVAKRWDPKPKNREQKMAIDGSHHHAGNWADTPGDCQGQYPEMLI